MKKSSDPGQGEAWYSCWDCHRNLGMHVLDNAPRSCPYCRSHAVMFTIPPDTQWAPVNPQKEP